MTVYELSKHQLDELKDNYYFDEEIRCDPNIDDAELERLTIEYYKGYDFSEDDFCCGSELEACKNDFIRYLRNVYYGFDGIDGNFLRETIANIIDYAYKKYGHSKNEARYFIADLLPMEVGYDEVARFLPEFG